MTGETIPGYEILDQIGEGGMGQVFRARKEGSDEVVAVKLMPPSLWETSMAKGRFLREAILLSTLRHPNICELVDSGDTESGRFFFAAELAQGPTLEQRMIREDFSLERALDIVTQLAGGLAAAHAVGIIHRDVKPANLILLSDGTLKILDFGLAQFEAAADLRLEGEVVGTATYSSPEQLRGDTCDPRCDLWALGVILYEMIAGNVPFRGGSFEEVARNVLESPPQPLEERRPGTPEPVERLVARLLSKDPDGRPDTAAELEEELVRLRGDLAVAGEFADLESPVVDGLQGDGSFVGKLKRLFS